MRTQSLETTKVNEITQKVISQSYKTPPTVREMANLAGMSVSKFNIVFNNQYGETPRQYILGKKLAEGRELLQTGRYSISQTAYKVGFNHPSAFTRLFKHKFQCTPTEAIFSNQS